MGVDINRQSFWDCSRRCDGNQFQLLIYRACAVHPMGLIERVPSNFGEPWDQVYSSNFCDSHFCLERRVTSEALHLFISPRA